MHGVKLVRQRVGEVRADEGVLCIPSIDGVARKLRMIAEIFHLVIAKPAIAIDASHPGDANACADRRFRRCTVDDLAYDLVPRNKPLSHLRQIAFYNVQIGPADPTGEHPQKQMPRLHLRARCIFDAKILSRRNRLSIEYGGLHGEKSPSILT